MKAFQLWAWLWWGDGQGCAGDGAVEGQRALRGGRSQTWDRINISSSPSTLQAELCFLKRSAGTFLQMLVSLMKLCTAALCSWRLEIWEILAFSSLGWSQWRLKGVLLDSPDSALPDLSSVGSESGWIWIFVKTGVSRWVIPWQRGNQAMTCGWEDDVSCIFSSCSERFLPWMMTLW